MKWLFLWFCVIFFILAVLFGSITGNVLGSEDIGGIALFSALILFILRFLWRSDFGTKLRFRISSLILTLSFIGRFAFNHGLNNFKPGSEPDGFRGIKWGTKLLAAFPNLKKIKRVKSSSESYPFLESYLKDEEDLKLGRANLETIEYCFWDEKFIGVAIVAKDPEDWFGLKEVTFEKFGKGFQPSKHIEEYEWRGKKTSAFFRKEEETKLGELFIGSEESLKELKTYIKQKAKEGARKGF
jgi:hypothetical protein